MLAEKQPISAFERFCAQAAAAVGARRCRLLVAAPGAEDPPAAEGRAGDRDGERNGAFDGDRDGRPVGDRREDERAETAALDRLNRRLLHEAGAATPQRPAPGDPPGSLAGLVLRDASGAPLAAAAFAFDAAGPRPAALEACRPILDFALSALLDALARAADLRAIEARCSRLSRQVDSDALTGLSNTRAFRDLARRRLAEPSRDRALILLDIDHLKRVNDVFGHAFGDAYIRTVARALEASLPDTALIGRIGGDEFAMMVDLPRPGHAYLAGLLERCRASVQRAAAMLGKPDLGRVSIGVSRSPEQAETLSSLFEKADAALYAAKDSGRGAIVHFRPGPHRRFNRRELAKGFSRAVREGRVVPFLQPLVDLDTGQCLGFEVLARWIEIDGAVLLPGEFSGIFRDHRNAELLTREMLRQGLDVFAAWRGRHGPRARRARLAVNLTTLDLMNPEFAFDLQAELSERGLDWSTITLEVTENIMLGDVNGQIHRNLTELRARGAKLAMDDFGTGYGGLQHLGRWPLDVLKVDRQFVQRLHEGEHARAVIEAIAGIAGRCGFDVVAEGIETRDQLAALRGLGCRMGQGEFFDRPLPAAQAVLAPLDYDLGQVERSRLIA
ncbi:putative bifunctional diguanylate cyclase/phosphodiesterase [Albimonas pacifica]|uniref:putative bifunctional diguanylate cyclase/phosphodiesterase n=1 Tax=Albimonas pacifica TaxID=1114924 RepID=UPI0015A594BF|nr:bifunctional diguanylate cyclase/phosphodiesterase [Albimonas pacifica]